MNRYLYIYIYTFFFTLAHTFSSCWILINLANSFATRRNNCNAYVVVTPWFAEGFQGEILLAFGLRQTFQQWPGHLIGLDPQREYGVCWNSMGVLLFDPSSGSRINSFKQPFIWISLWLFDFDFSGWLLVNLKLIKTMYRKSTINVMEVLAIQDWERCSMI